VLFGQGRELGVDPGRARSQAYRLPIHSRWYKATLSHNTVLVDRKSQAPAAGQLECFAANDRYGAVEAQAIDRTHRIGQSRRVFAYRLIARGTVEEKIVELQKSKRDLAEALIASDGGVLRQLTAEDLQILLS
jgi:hypothetical protein